MSENLINALLDTRALELAPAGEMFWYTSGTIGPYYINTHFLFGGQERAGELLAFIDAERSDLQAFARQLSERVVGRYRVDPAFAAVVDALACKVDEESVDLVSGGERRDWFFSTAVAHALDKPHLLIFKDRSLHLDEGETGHSADRLHGATVAHVADLVTEASSYFRAWIPAIASAGGELLRSVNVVDRGQGGIKALGEQGVPSSALLRVDEGLFEQLLDGGKIDREQSEALSEYLRDPHGAMAAFLSSHGSFLRSALESATSNTAKRARLLVERNPYNLDIEALTA